jgi:hypothetical protein
MNYLERYRSGEYAQVWEELQALGPTVREESNYALAREVARETMRRVNRNCERIVSRLRASGYRFGMYPDGSSGYYSEGPLLPPSKSLHADVAALEARVGPLPLSLAAFWENVGSVDLVGMHPGWPGLLDPLVVYPPEATLSALDDWEENLEQGETAEQVTAILAPDDLHKDNVSGGDPYSAALPEPTADFVLLNERHGLLFVPYLRLAILRWGGFPGLDGQKVSLDLLAELVAGLEPF